MNYPKFKVCVRCFTYNQSKYIEDAMNGFTMQQTNFPYVCCIVDDASLDGEQNLIKKYIDLNFDFSIESVSYKKETDYAHIIYAQHKINRFCFFAVVFLKNNHYTPLLKPLKYDYISEWRDNCEYEAVCEGDDYWVDPKKLMMQVDFLDKNSDFGLVHTDFELTNGTRNHYVEKNHDGVYFPYILDGSRGTISIQFLTVLYRMSVYNILPKYFLKEGWVMGDAALWIEFAKYTKIHYIPTVTSKYRILDNSASHSQDIHKLIQFAECGRQIQLYYADKFSVKIQNNGFTSIYYEVILRYTYRLEEKVMATRYFFKCLCQRKITFKSFVFFLGTIIPFLKRLLGDH